MREEVEISDEGFELLDDLANHPVLALFNREELFSDPLFARQNRQTISNKLYLIPTSHGEIYDSDFAPVPSHLRDLPDANRWTLTYLISALEIMASRRPPSQVARTTHRYTYNSLLRQIGTLKEVPKIKSIRRSQPIDGVIELTATLIFKERIRALVARFEGVDRKWLCTEISLI